MNYDLVKYGYKWVGMKEIYITSAIDRIKNDEEVYLLYEDDTESLCALVENAIDHYNNGGRLGIHKTEEEIHKEICYSYNQVGDIDMLIYFENLKRDSADKKFRKLLGEMFYLNNNKLDTEEYYEKRREFLIYLGYDWDDCGSLYYKGVISEDDYYYIVFVINDIMGYVDKNFGCDDQYNKCKEIANKFISSKYNVNTKGLYECVEEYLTKEGYIK